MINWISLISNALWIVGCSFILAAFSYAAWVSAEYKQKFSVSLRSKGVWRGLHVGGILVCAGLAATSKSLVEAILWLLLGISLLINLLRVRFA